ncbi:MAG: DUF434 domain-containing protein [Promethearchaeati archaeon SRVP18_Atabeyarchaeia-1]
MILGDNLVEAARDLRYLLSRGYSREASVRFVATGHGVTLGERYILMRAVYDDAEAEKRRRKLVSLDEIRGETVSIDGYNLLITVESMLAKKLLVQCDDNITRDVSGVFGKHKITTVTTQALSLILRKLKDHAPKEVRFTYDKQVSKSGELASQTRMMMAEFELKGTATTALKTDIATLESGGVTVSSDSVVVDRAKRILDLAGELARQESYSNILRLPH